MTYQPNTDEEFEKLKQSVQRSELIQSGNPRSRWDKIREIWKLGEPGLHIVVYAIIVLTIIIVFAILTS